MIKEVKIRDICNVFDGPHATPKRIKSGPVYLGIKAISEDGTLIPSEFTYLSDEDFKKWTKRVTPQAGDIVFSYEATLGRYAIIPNGFYGCLGRRLAVIRAKNDDVNVEWLYYYFKSPKWKAFIENNIVYGSTVLRISIDDFPSYPVFLPERPQQDTIASVLSNIDQKITLNKSINTELEKTTKLLYDYWFVQFDFPDENGKPYRTSGGAMEYNEQLKREIPKGWTAQDLGVICSMYQPEILSAKSLSKEGKYLVYGSNGEIGRYDNYNHELSEVIVSCRGDCGNIHYTMPKSWITGNAMVIRPNNDFSITKEWLYNALHYIGIKKVITGSVQGQLTRTNMENLKVLLPKAEVLKEYQNVVTHIFEKVIKNRIENIELTALRDFLLPLLMNGQVTIKDA